MLFNHFRYFCDTEQEFVYEWREDSEGPPTLCRNDGGEISDITIVESRSTTFAIDADGHLETSQEPLPGSEKYFFSPNLCDPCAWYEGAEEVVEQALTPDGAYTVYSSSNTYWIDLNHGRQIEEDKIILETPGYVPQVEVQVGGTGDWVLKTENSWGSSDDGDYSINYEEGTVTFNEAQGATDNVRATYFKQDGYQFTIVPTAGKRLKVQYAEIQYTNDMVMNADVAFEVWVYNPADPSWDPPTSMPKVRYNWRQYRRVIDFHLESRPLPTLEAHGGADRGMAHPLITAVLDFLTYWDIRSSQGAEIRLVVSNGLSSFTGEHASLTFKTTCEDE